MINSNISESWLRFTRPKGTNWTVDELAQVIEELRNVSNKELSS